MTYTCEITTIEFEGKARFTRTIQFEAEDGGRHLRKEITKYENMGLNYNAELKQKAPDHFELIWTERE